MDLGLIDDDLSVSYKKCEYLHMRTSNGKYRHNIQLE